MYSWSYKVMTYLVTPEGRYRVSVPSEQVQSALRGAAELEAISNLLVKDSLQALTETPAPQTQSAASADVTKSTASESTLQGENSAAPTGSGDSKSDTEAAVSSSTAATTDEANPDAATGTTATTTAATSALKPLVGELDGLERAMLEHFEILCFVLVEFWRQKLILCLKKTNPNTSSTAPSAPVQVPPPAAGSAVAATPSTSSVARAVSDSTEVAGSSSA